MRNEVKKFYLFFPHTNLMISICFPLNLSKKHIASCGLSCSANQAPSILNQITIEIGWFHSALRLLLCCMLEIWLFIFALFSLKKHPLVVFVLCLLGAFHLFVFCFSIDYDRDGAGTLKGRRRLRFSQLQSNLFKAKSKEKSEINDSTNRTMKRNPFAQTSLL